jgi:hypothetical protein
MSAYSLEHNSLARCECHSLVNCQRCVCVHYAVCSRNHGPVQVIAHDCVVGSLQVEPETSSAHTPLALFGKCSWSVCVSLNVDIETA